jgi:hypothetical protein
MKSNKSDVMEFTLHVLDLVNEAAEAAKRGMLSDEMLVNLSMLEK